MIKVHNDTTNGYFIMMSLPYMDEIIIITIVMAIWVFSIMQFFRFVYRYTYWFTKTSRTIWNILTEIKYPTQTVVRVADSCAFL